MVMEKLVSWVLHDRNPWPWNTHAPSNRIALVQASFHETECLLESQCYNNPSDIILIDDDVVIPASAALVMMNAVAAPPAAVAGAGTTATDIATS